MGFTMLRLVLESVPVVRAETVGMALLSLVRLEEDAPWRPAGPNGGRETAAPKSVCTSLKDLCEL
jgi:hypothetical protein